MAANPNQAVVRAQEKEVVHDEQEEVNREVQKVDSDEKIIDAEFTEVEEEKKLERMMEDEVNNDEKEASKSRKIIDKTGQVGLTAGKTALKGSEKIIKGAGKMVSKPASWALGKGSSAIGAGKDYVSGQVEDTLKSSYLWLFILTVIVLTVDAYTGFAGLSLSENAKFFTSINSIKNIFFNGIIIGFLVVYLLRKFIKGEIQEGVIFAIIVLFIWFLLFRSTSALTFNIVAHLILALGFYGFLFKQKFKEDLLQAKIYLLVFLFVDLFIYGILNNNILKGIPLLNQIPVNIVFNIYLLYLLSLCLTEEVSVFLKFMPYVYIMIILFFIGLPAIGFAMGKNGVIIVPEQGQQTLNFFERSWSNFKIFWTQSVNNTITQKDRYTAMASGDYYTGQVDENAKIDLGVYIEKLEPAQPEFKTDEPITLWAVLKAITLNDPINVSVTCDSEGLPSDIVHPDKSIKINKMEMKDLDCTFYERRFAQGSRTFAVNALFNFETMSYNRNYFMEYERMSAMKRQNIDPLEQLDINEKESKTIFTNGPIDIGIKVQDSPIGIKLGEIQRFPLRFTVSNRWSGSVQEITDLYIIIPEEFSLQKENEKYCGTYNFKTCDELSGEKPAICEIENRDRTKIYVLTKGLKDKGLFDIEEYKTFICNMELPSENTERLLGDTPVSAKYFKVSVKYKYKIKEETTISIGKGVVEQTEIKKRNCNKNYYDADTKIQGIILPEGVLQEYYVNYQDMVYSTISKSKKPSSKTDSIQTEALVAAIMTEYSKMGTETKGNDEDDNKIPDFITGCLYIHQSSRENPKDDILCSVTTINSILSNKPDIVITQLIDEYAKQTRIDHIERISIVNIKNYYDAWINLLCEKPKTQTSGTSSTTTKNDDKDVPIITGLAEKEKTMNSIELNWKANKIIKESTVEYGTSDSYGKQIKGNYNVPTTSNNVAKITGLQPGTKYFYKINSMDTNGNIGTAQGYFITIQEQTAGASGITSGNTESTPPVGASV